MRTRRCIVVARRCRCVACARERARRLTALHRRCTAVRSLQPCTRAPAGRPKPRIVFLGDSLTAGLGCRRSRAFPSLIGKKLESARARLRRRQRRRVGRHVGRRRCAGSTGRSRAMCACWSSRSARTTACAACRRRELKKNLAAVLDRARARKHPGHPRRHGGAAEQRHRTTRATFRDVYSELAAGIQGALHPVPAGGRGRRCVAEPGRRHSSERSRRANRRGPGVEGTRAGAAASKSARHSSLKTQDPDLSLNDSATRRQQDRSQAAASR